MFAEWNKGDLDSFLIEITAEVLRQTDAKTGKPLVDVILDEAEQKGTGRWTVKSALDLGVPVTGIAEAVFARALSGSVAQRKATTGLASGDIGEKPSDAKQFIDDVSKALYASKIVAYAQGFNQIQAGSAEYDWGITPGDMATIWRGGCIIRAKFLNRIKEAFDEDADLSTLIVAPYFRDAIENRPSTAGAASSSPRLSWAFRSPGSLRPCPTTTRCAPSGCPRRSPRACGTSSGPIPTAASMPSATRSSTRCGAATAARCPPKRSACVRDRGIRSKRDLAGSTRSRGRSRWKLDSVAKCDSLRATDPPTT